MSLALSNDLCYQTTDQLKVGKLYTAPDLMPVGHLEVTAFIRV